MGTACFSKNGTEKRYAGQNGPGEVLVPSLMHIPPRYPRKHLRRL